MIEKDPFYNSIIIRQLGVFSKLDKFEKICSKQIFSNLSNSEKKLTKPLIEPCPIIMDL